MGGKCSIEQNQSLLTIFLAILGLSFVADFFGGLPLLFFDFSYNLAMYAYYPIFMALHIIIDPVLIFILFYHIGKKFELKLNLIPTIIRLLIGSYLGHFLATNLIYILAAWEAYPSILLSSIFSNLFLHTTFLSFSALAIAYLRNNREKTDDFKKRGI